MELLGQHGLKRASLLGKVAACVAPIAILAALAGCDGTDDPVVLTDTLTCDVSVVRDTVKLTLAQAKSLDGKRVHTCAVGLGQPPSAVGGSVLIDGKAVPNLAEALADDGTALPSGFSVSNGARLYVEIDGAWVEVRNVGVSGLSS